MTCYDFPSMVIHENGCPYTRGGECHPRPSGEAPASLVREYAAAMEFMLTGRDDGHFSWVLKPGGTSVDPHTGETTW